MVKRLRFLFIFLIGFLFVININSISSSIYSEDSLYGVAVENITNIIEYVNQTNHTEYWDTNEGVMDNVDDLYSTLDVRYYLEANPYSFYNSTSWDNPYSYWNSTFATFNKTYADTLYSLITEPLWSANLTAHNASWNSITNTSYMTWDKVINGTAILLWTNNLTAHNATWSSIFNQTYNDAWKYATNNTFRLIDNHTFNGNVVMTNNLTIDTNMFFLNSNKDRIGIGTTTPAGKLHLKEGYLFLEHSTNPYIYLLTDATDSSEDGWTINTDVNNNLSFKERIAGASSERIRITTGGNVGIGTTSPDYMLDVEGDINAEGDSYYGSGKEVIRSAGGTNTVYMGDVDGGGGNAELRLRSAGGDRITIQTGGNVGIGTTSPQALLDIKGGTNFGIRLSSTTTNADNYLIFGESSVDAFKLLYNGTNDELNFINDVTDANIMTIERGGKVGIGTTSPSQKLEVNGTIEAGTTSEIGQINLGQGAQVILNSSTDRFQIQNWDGAAYQTVFYALDGNVGIGTTSPSFKLNVWGDVGLTGDVVIQTNQYGMRADTSDGSDNQHIKLGGGGAYSSSRGGVIILGGNEDSTYPGQVMINPGADAGMQVKIDSTLYVGDGNVGIGTTTPQNTLNVIGAGNFTTGVICGTNATSQNITMYSPNHVAYSCGVTNGGAWACV